MERSGTREDAWRGGAAKNRSAVLSGSDGCGDYKKRNSQLVHRADSTRNNKAEM